MGSDEQVHGRNAGRRRKALSQAVALKIMAWDSQIPLASRKEAWRLATNMERLASFVDRTGHTHNPKQGDGCFPIETVDISPVIDLLEDSLRLMNGEQASAWLDALLVLQWLPNSVASKLVTITFSVRTLSALEWLALEADEFFLKFTMGEHFYASDVGGDTTSETIFHCDVWGGCRGDLTLWLRRLETLDRSTIEIDVVSD